MDQDLEPVDDVRTALTREDGERRWRQPVDEVHHDVSCLNGIGIQRKRL